MHASFRSVRRNPTSLGWAKALFASFLLQGLSAVAEEVALIAPDAPLKAWRFDNGREFPGATGAMTADDAVEPQHRPALRLDGDFTGGGNYVQVGRSLPALELETLSFWVKAPQGLETLTLRLIDGTGQCHQFNLRVESHGNWQRVLFPVARYFDKAGTSASVELVKRYEGWGGAKDGKWHNPAKGLHVLVSRHAFGEAKKGSLWIANAKLLTTAPKAAPYKESFDTTAALPAGWQAAAPAGCVTIVEEAAFEGPRALRVRRDETQLNDGVAVTGAAFAAAPGAWNVGGALRSALHSPDNSFAVRLDLETLDAAGGVLERRTLVDQTGTQNWKAFARPVEFPQGTAQARFALAFHKTHGSCDVDALSAVPAEAKREERIVERIVIGSEAVGNLFYPEDEVQFSLDVQSSRPLPANECRAVATVTDYWGAEQLAPVEVALEPDGQVQGRFRFGGAVALPKDALEVGKYYELQVAVPLTGFEDGAEYSGFARLPVAESRQYPAEQIPFTIRNWDSRIPDYQRIASRIGHRQIGTWGDNGWERIRDLGAKWYGGPPGVSQVEREGWKNITEEKLRQNALDFMTKHKDNEHLACIVLGNEPNERHEKIPEKIRAYQVAYEALKSVKPDVKIVTTSVPALESFFAAGYHKYTDVYDFHVYETYENVRQAIRRYRELGRKYNAEKPIWCTELGLNSQGQTRYAVAQELVKKITAFFAEGGENVSWFTILYPDPNGKARGASGDAHNTFDCQYSQYNPRLDAIMYYAMINGVTVKRFADEAQHADGVQAYQFRDERDNCLQVLWREGGRVDRAIPLEGVARARLIRIDGSEAVLAPRDGAVTLGLSGEPLLLRYEQPATKLPRALPPAALVVPDQPLAILKGKSRDIRATGPGLTADDVSVLAPPRWTVATRQDGPDAVVCTVTAPAETGARTGRVMVQRKTAGGVCAEVTLSLPIMSPVSLDIAAATRNAAGEPGVGVRLSNNGAESKALTWTVELTDAWTMQNGVFKPSQPEPVQAFLKGDTEGQATLAAGAERTLRVDLADAAPQTLYRVRVNVTDDAGRRVSRERLVGGFARAARAAQPVTVDGTLDEAVWKDAPAERIDGATSVFRFGKAAPWRDATDLSATWRAAWDADHLYLGIEVTDDAHRVQFADASIWNQDGLQFLFDPARTAVEKSGKYDYSASVGTKGPQAWCHLSAHSSVAEGAAPEIRLAATDLPGSAGGKVYELAIPWSRLAPFVPEVGANLGMNLLLNEDDGEGRVGFMGWFSGAHSKDLDQVGDLVLGR